MVFELFGCTSINVSEPPYKWQPLEIRSFNRFPLSQALSLGHGDVMASKTGIQKSTQFCVTSVADVPDERPAAPRTAFPGQGG